MSITKKYIDDLSYKVLGCAIDVHRQLGPGLLESVYEKCLARELSMQNIPFRKQETIPINYKGLMLDAELRFDLLVEDLIIVEIKSVEDMVPVFEAQILSYMRLLQKPKGLLINFNCINLFKQGQKSLVNEYYSKLPIS